MFSSSKIAALSLATSAIFLAACGAKTDDASGVKIPDAPAAALQTVISEFAAGNGGILWQALPGSYQSDVNTLVQLAGTKIDPEIYDQSFALLGRIGDVLGKQQAFILNSAMSEGRSAEEKAEIEAAFPSLLGFIETVATSSIATSSGLQSFDGQQFFNTTVSQVATYATEIAAIAGEETSLADYVAVVVTAEDVTDTSALLTINLPEQEPEEEAFSKVEGRWVPTEMATGWSEGILEATENLNAMSSEDMAAQKPQIMGVLTMLDGVLTQLEAAETQEQFDQAGQAAMMPLMGLMMMSQSMGGGMDAPAPMPPVPAAPGE